jgi:hypothetical protein
MAIASLVLGILAFPGLCLYGVVGLVFGITALILGRMAIGRIRNSNGALGGYGLAQAGWICGLVAASLSVLSIAFSLLLVGVPWFLSVIQSTPTPSP